MEITVELDSFSTEYVGVIHFRLVKTPCDSSITPSSVFMNKPDIHRLKIRSDFVDLLYDTFIQCSEEINSWMLSDGKYVVEHHPLYVLCKRSGVAGVSQPRECNGFALR